jgi:hypothetical protein
MQRNDTMLNTRKLRLTLMACAIAAATGTALAQQAAPTAPAAPATSAAPAAQTVRPGDLLTSQERDAFRQQMQQAATPEERQKIRDAHRAAIEQRAKEKGVTLAQPYQGHRGPGAQGGPDGRRGPGGPGGPGMGPRGQNGPYAQLFTQAERDQFREKMHSAQTVEDRMKVRDEMHAMAETRAKEQGVTLPPPGQGRHYHGPGRGPGPNRGPAQSTTPPAS